MKIRIMIMRGVIFLIIFGALIGCGKEDKTSNGKENISEVKVDESKKEFIESEIENSDDEKKKIQYYDTLDGHMQLLFDSFISCEWKKINDLLNEFKSSGEESVAVYTTPLEGFYLVLEYMPKMRSWQAYLGEFIENQKEGRGVMLSKRENGYADTNIYIGEWNEDVPNGQGILSNSIYNMECVFEGTFKNGKFDSAIQAFALETPEIYVDWETIKPQYFVDMKWNYSDLVFENGKPIPATIEVVDQYIGMSELTERELGWMELKNDGQYYYRIYNDAHNYVMSIGAKKPEDGYRGEISSIYGTLLDLDQETATYGVACYSTNRLDCY